MKKLILLPLFAVVLAVAASAFKTEKSSEAVNAAEKAQTISEVKKTNEVWYTFSSTNYSQVNDRTKYVNTGSDTDPGCLTEGNVCAIKLPDSGSTNPTSGDFAGLLSQIQQSQNDHESTDPDLIQMRQ
ncbi:MAG TPA: hypothetical protein VGN63_16935 [Flavisolibacter sp.]|jgi:hypothetical protein|nr:hypothetical protein [Flavisolibacter sp.]